LGQVRWRQLIIIKILGVYPPRKVGMVEKGRRERVERRRITRDKRQVGLKIEKNREAARVPMANINRPYIWQGNGWEGEGVG
jgi:hypothetical protein